MRTVLSRRHLLAAASAMTGLSALRPIASGARVIPASPKDEPLSAPGEQFPRLEPERVEAFVRVAHFDFDQVRRLVGRQPALARASWDWGFGDWESALGAASHVGRPDIARVLLDHGARPNLFTAAMLGHLEVVRALVTARPGIQHTLGPHGISLLAHARAAGSAAEPVVRYLEAVGGADPSPPTEPLADEQRDLLVGTYVYGAGRDERLIVDLAGGDLGIRRLGGVRRVLQHKGELRFFPQGVPEVTIAFQQERGSTSLRVHDPDVVVTATRP